MKLISVEKVSKLLGGRFVLKQVGLEVHEGETIWLSGPNGAGKSTLLKIIARVMRPDFGSIGYHNREQSLDDHESVSRLIGYAGHEPLLYGDLSLAENLALFASLYNLADARKIVHEAAENLGISAKNLNRRAGHCSPGVRQRAALARAVIHQPRILIFDEPTSSLDRAGISLLRTLLGSFIDRGAAVLVVDHLGDLLPWSRKLSIEAGRLADDRREGAS